MIWTRCLAGLRLLDYRIMPLFHCRYSATSGTCLVSARSQQTSRSAQHVVVVPQKRNFTGPLSNSDDVSKRVSFQKENIWTIPNLLSLSRLVSSPILGYFVLTENYLWGLGLFVISGITDLVDGVIARRFPSQSSMLGSVLDPLADKCLIAVLTVTLAISNLLPLPLVLLILGRDVLLVMAAFYLRYTTLPPPRTFARFWDVQRSTLQVTPSMIGKINTILQLTLVGMTVGAPVFGFIDHPVLQTLWYIVGCTTIATGISYTTQLRGFKLNLKKTQTTSATTGTSRNKSVDPIRPKN